MFAPLLAFGDEMGRLGEWIDDLSERVGDVGDRSVVSLVLVVVGLIVVVTVLGAVLQVAREILTNWDLTLVRTTSGLRRTAGLLSTTSRSSTVRRIQSITTDDTPPQRWLGFTHARLRVFGDNDLSLPGARPDELARLRALVLGATDAARARSDDLAVVGVPNGPQRGGPRQSSSRSRSGSRSAVGPRCR